MRFGITDGCAHTLEEIGEHFGVTSERIRQIEAKGLRKIRFLLSKNIEQCPLTPCERSVLEMLFGRADGHWHTLKETADNLGLTCERTSQIESTAFLKICQSEKQRIEVQSKCEEPVTHDPDEILAQCIADNAVQRQRILKCAIDTGKASKYDVMRFLRQRMNINGMKAGNEIAFQKWKEDYNFIRSL